MKSWIVFLKFTFLHYFYGSVVWVKATTISSKFVMASTSGVKERSMAERLQILEKLKNGARINDVAYEYGLSVRTIRRYRQHSKSIRHFAANPKHLDMRRQRIPPYSDVENRLYNWYVQKTLAGDYLTDSILVEKAKEMEAEFGNTSNFKASRGWLWNWKKKYDVRRLATCMETTDSNEAAAYNFTREFLDILVEENIKEENLYNMDECSLLWKFLPQKALTRERENIKGKKEAVTIGLCANASGMHKLSPLFVHKFANPRALKYCKDILPVTYKNQRSAWVSEDIFRDWYHNDFKRSVKQRHTKEGRTGKVLLLVDNFKGHKLREGELDDGYFKLIFLPPNTSPLIQPMDQDIISEFKKSFRHKLLRRVLQYGKGVTQFYADYDIKDCIDLIGETWDEITPQNIYCSWTKLLNCSLPCNVTIVKEECTINEESTEQPFKTMSAEEVTEWITECEQSEFIPEELAIEEESNSSPFPIEEQEIDRLLHNLEILIITEPEIKVHAKAIIDYFNKKEET